MIGVQADVLTALCAGVALGLLIARGAPCSAAARLLRATSRCFAKEVSGETPPTAPRAHSTSATAPHLRSPRSGRTRFQTQALVETIESLGDDDIDALIDAGPHQWPCAPLGCCWSASSGRDRRMRADATVNELVNTSTRGATA